MEASVVGRRSRAAPRSAAARAKTAAADAATSGDKVAVVLVHGIGEQIPMATLRGFVETMWTRDPEIEARDPTDPPQDGNPVWWKPDARNDSAELWRITTRRAKGSGRRTDFYEFYWADLTDANTLDQLKDFFGFLLLRSFRQVPPEVAPIWAMLWAATLVVGFFAGWQALAAIGWAEELSGWATTLIAIAGALYAALIGAVLSYAGDVARYCRAKPPNIAARREIRERGFARLRAITESGDYGRVIVVGHSLGSIIAYDLLKLLWADWAARTPVRETSALFKALAKCRAAGDALDDAPDDEALRAAFRAAQALVFRAAKRDPRPDAVIERDGLFKPWLISDFVTVGAALTHAHFLLERDADAFRQGRKERRFPSIPPVVDGQHGYVYDGKAGTLRIDHAAVFSSVRWTNLYDDSYALLFGDVVSGPVADKFGPGAVDVRTMIMRSEWRLFPRFFTHTLYWTDTRTAKRRKAAPAGAPVQLRALRRALRLGRP